MSVPDLSHPVRILSFDPGTTNMGWAISEYSILTGDFVVFHYGLFKSSRIAKKRKDEVEIFGQRLISLMVVAEEVSRIILHHQPHFVVSEDTFFHAGTPQAHVALLLCINSVERVLYNLQKDGRLKNRTAGKLYKLAPATIKMITGGHGTSIKQKIIDSVTADNIIKFNTPKEDLASILTEHEADAIACGYSFAKTNTFHL